MVSDCYYSKRELGMPMYLPNERLDSTCTAVDLIKGDFADNLGAVLSVGNFVLADASTSIVAKAITNFLSFLTFSISPGTFSAKTSFKVYQWWWLAELPMAVGSTACLGFAGGIAAEAIESGGADRRRSSTN